MSQTINDGDECSSRGGPEGGLGRSHWQQPVTTVKTTNELLRRGSSCPHQRSPYAGIRHTHHVNNNNPTPPLPRLLSPTFACSHSEPLKRLSLSPWLVQQCRWQFM